MKVKLPPKDRARAQSAEQPPEARALYGSKLPQWVRDHPRLAGALSTFIVTPMVVVPALLGVNEAPSTPLPSSSQSTTIPEITAPEVALHQPRPSVQTTRAEGPREPALAGFTNVQRQWSEPVPGIKHLRFTADGPHIGHVFFIDLRRPEFDVRVSRPDERGMTPTEWAQKVGAVAAFNGDFYRTDGSYQPMGLTVGDGVFWPDSHDGQGFIAFDANNRATLNFGGPPAERDPAWTDVIGMHASPLVVNGEAQLHQDPFMSTQRHPRTGLGTAPDGQLVVVQFEGRRIDAIGATGHDVARVLVEAGVQQGAMADGGGSVEGSLGQQRVTTPTYEGPRSVSNSLGIVIKSPG